MVEQRQVGLMCNYLGRDRISEKGKATGVKKQVNGKFEVWSTAEELKSANEKRN